MTAGKLTDDAQKILEQILNIGIDQGPYLANRKRFPTPGTYELFQLCELLSRTPREEDIQIFMEENVGFLPSLLGSPDNTDLAVLFKPWIGTQYRADFCILQAYQGGAVAHLVEIETSHERLFNKKGSSSQRLASAENQIENWRIWINRNRIHFAKELIRATRSIPMIGTPLVRASGFRLSDPEKIEAIWSAFGGFDEPFFSYTILIGRWSNLTQEEKQRLISRNRHGPHDFKIYTYEQVARLASFRLEREEW